MDKYSKYTRIELFIISMKIKSSAKEDSVILPLGLTYSASSIIVIISQIYFDTTGKKFRDMRHSVERTAQTRN